MTALSRCYEDDDERGMTTPVPRLARVGRYILHPAIARGGMATVHAARLVADEGVTRLVAAKRLHPHFVDDPEFVAMFHDEARIASRIHHPNVVPVLDVVRSNEEIILVQEYVHGVPLSHLFKLGLGGEPIPVRIAAAIVAGVLSGLHAAHEATDESGEPLGIVHRDVSPQNVIVSVDGVPRLVDFGIAKAKTSVHHTREGFFKGKLAYMSPEQIRAEPVSRRTDIYAAGVMLWELVVNRRFYDGKNDAEFVRDIAIGLVPSLMDALQAERETLSEERWEAVLKLDPIVSRAMATAEMDRYTSALVMATELADAVGLASPSEVAAWVRDVGADYLEERQRVLAENEEVYRTSVSHQRVATRGPGGVGRRTLTGGLPPVVEADDSGRSSGPRIRSPRDDAGEPLAGDASPNTSTTLSLHTALDRHIHARALVPWVVVAGLLVIVALLAGMAIERDPPPVAPVEVAAAKVVTLAGTTTAAPPPVATTTTEPAAVRPVAAPSATPAPSAPPPAPLPTTHRSFSRPAPIVVYRPAPAPAPTSAASAKADCNPPFYFEGSKKIFKPSCL